MYYLPQSPNTTPEEKIIHELVDDIYQSETKIAEISQKQINPIDNPNEIEIEKITQNQIELQNKITVSSTILKDNISHKNSEKKTKLKAISDINEEINEIKRQLSEYNPISFKSLLLRKYVLAKTSSSFISNEQIEEILSNGNNINDHQTEEYKKYQRDLESKQNAQSSCKNSIFQINNKITQIGELLNMLKEEKYSIKEALINIISQKESIEEIIKMDIINMISATSNENILKSFPLHIAQGEIELYYYELINIDITKATDIICEGLMEVVEKNNNNSIQNESLLAEIINGNEKNEKIPDNKTLLSNIYESLQNIVKNEILNFIKSIKIYSNENIKKKSIPHFILSLSNIIINTIMFSNSNNSQNFSSFNLNYNLNSNSLSQYLICSLKVFYYDKLIEDRINFLTKEYKNIKKERLNQLEELRANLTKLNSKLDDLNIKIKEIEESIKIIQEQQEKKKSEVDLSLSEKAYVELCIKGNMTIQRKKEMEGDIKKIEDEIQILTENNIEEKEKTEKEIENCEARKTQLRKEIETEKLKQNQEIIMLRKLIADKYSIIKSQLQIYKTKHGSNLPIYNKLMDSINKTIKTTQFKTKYHQRVYQHPYQNEISFIQSEFIDNNTINSPEINNLNLILDKKKYRTHSTYISKMNNNIGFDIEFKEDLKEQSLNTKRSPNDNTHLQISKMNISIDKISKQKNENQITIENNSNFNIPSIQTPHHKTKSAFITSNPINISMSGDIGNTTINPGQNTKNERVLSPSIIFNDIERNNDSILIEERGKLAKKIQSIKNTISQYEHKHNQPFGNLLISKISSLTQITFCYYRMLTNTSKKFSPFLSVSNSSLINPPYNFVKGTISLNKNYKSIFLSPSISLTPPLEIPLDIIDNTIVNSVIKKIIEIHREYRKCKNTKILNMEEFAEKEAFKSFGMTKNEIIKAATIHNFNFSLLVNQSKRIELIMGNYEDFKMWINGIAFIIKNKDKLV